MGSWEYGKMPSTVIIKRNVECWLSKKKKPKRKVRWKRGKSLWRGKCFNKKFINAFLPLKTFSQRHTNSNSFSWRDMRWRWTKKKLCDDYTKYLLYIIWCVVSHHLYLDENLWKIQTIVESLMSHVALPSTPFMFTDDESLVLCWWQCRAIVEASSLFHSHDVDGLENAPQTTMADG